MGPVRSWECQVVVDIGWAGSGRRCLRRDQGRYSVAGGFESTPTYCIFHFRHAKGKRGSLNAYKHCREACLYSNTLHTNSISQASVASRKRSPRGVTRAEILFIMICADGNSMSWGSYAIDVKKLWASDGVPVYKGSPIGVVQIVHLCISQTACSTFLFRPATGPPP